MSPLLKAYKILLELGENETGPVEPTLASDSTEPATDQTTEAARLLDSKPVGRESQAEVQQ